MREGYLDSWSALDAFEASSSDTLASSWVILSSSGPISWAGGGAEDGDGVGSGVTEPESGGGGGSWGAEEEGLDREALLRSLRARCFSSSCASLSMSLVCCFC